MSLSDSILASLVTSTAAVSFFLWLFKESLKSKLTLEVEQRLNQQKADLEKIRDSFQFQIQQAMLTFQLQTTKAHEFYPELYEKLKIAEGHAGRPLGIKMAYTWEEYSLDDLKTMMINRKVVSGKIDELLTLIKSDRPDGIKKMDKYLNMVEHQQSERLLVEARNFLTLKSLYMTDEITNDCYTVCDEIWSAIVDAHPDHRDYKTYKASLDKVDKQMISVKEKMRKALTHKELN